MYRFASQFGVACAILLGAFVATGCDEVVERVSDEKVYDMTFRHEPGDNFVRVWRFMQQEAAEACMADPDRGWVRFHIDDLPEDPGESWETLDGHKLDCDDLEAGYPYLF